MTDRDAIMDGLARYARGVDERDFGAVGALFTADAAIDYAVEGGAKLAGRELASWLAGALAVFHTTQHHLGLPVIEVARDSARTRVPVIATHVQRRKDGRDNTAILYGTYTHEWSRTPDGWRIRALRFESHHGTGTFLGPAEVESLPARPR